MVGHSKWSKVKRIKGRLAVKRGAAFSKLVKETIVAARPGGGDLSGHPQLCSKRAVNKSSGQLPGGASSGPIHKNTSLCLPLTATPLRWLWLSV